MEFDRKQRFETLDTYRGIVIVNMIAYHFLYDVFVIFGGNNGWFRQPGIHAWQQFICCSFIILSGFVWPYGKKKSLKRGIFINFCGFVITAFTLIFTSDESIWFGVLNFLGCAVLLTIPVEKLLKKIPNWLGIVGSLALFLLLRSVRLGVFGFEPFTFGQVPEVMFQFKWLIPFGFPTDGFRSSDYFPIVPWYFLYVFGYFLGRILEKKEWFLKASHLRIPMLNWMGRKSIWIYMVHQVICYGVCLLIF